MASALRVLILQIPPKFKVPVSVLITSPVPVKASDTVKELMLFKEMLTTLTLGIERSPTINCELMLKVCTPELAEK
jgi:hypothetical protein